MLKPMPTTPTPTNPLQLHFIPLLQIINLVLTLLHALLIITPSSLAHRFRYFLPIPPSQIPFIQLTILLRIHL
ncbi:hypothetical protein OIU84_020495 [Salix udensis]|uniref:Uncharacterized protein n=1 Tax=Salix udensis TaxID=889485 RepID=A0AAD6KUK3_9ROSI|nr:hypothetical protein OIU84_020495 [Salix udensis]